ncbi:hypothetical protein G6O67_006520 [Ophiocordyceps sinensis]|uniref:CPAF-like PDZ domain-containing protein n=1 Tax=Ophiocordyceps sinensis TaxID=72228 RepID=A0A8H4LWB3_9HYPO|nr:hypothetical protein G6O67_006520 [Ophiocordyceps sinensis]
MRLSVLLSQASILASALSIPKPLGGPFDVRADACGAVREQLSRAPMRNATLPRTKSTSRTRPRIPGQAAHDCLKLIPFEGFRANQFIGQLRKYVEFQSTLEVLRNPPASYASDPVDILGRLQEIGGKQYENLYDFDVDLWELFNSAHDSHLGIFPCTLDIFRFERDHGGIVSMSPDGLVMPELFVYSDIQASKQGNASISSIAEINGQGAVEHLQDLARTFLSQDPDARWNELFRSHSWIAGQALHPNGSFIDNHGAWPGQAKTTVKFTNGSSVEIETMAELRGDDAFNSSSADEVLAAYCRPLSPEPRPPTDEPFENGIQGYPEPFARDPNNGVTGYFLDNETTVMVVSSFGGDERPRDYSRTVANVATDIINKTKASGRSKLILDVSGNAGGSASRFLNIFKLLFPGEFPFDAVRFRRTPATDAMAKALGLLNPDEAKELGTGLAFSAMVAPDQKTGFRTADDFLGAEPPELGVKVSSVYTLNFTLISSDRDPIEGFVPLRTTFDTAPFKPEDILVMGNGFCHSACAGFVNILANVGRVKTLAFGGRPQNGPMQIMGGVRGGQVMFFEYIAELVKKTNDILGNKTMFDGRPPPLSPEELKLANETMPPPIENMSYKVSGQVNFESAYLQGKEDRPLQFESQAADCRLFYTRDNILDPKTTWEAAKKATWGGGKCVEGSTGVADGGRAFIPQH